MANHAAVSVTAQAELAACTKAKKKGATSLRRGSFLLLRDVRYLR